MLFIAFGFFIGKKSQVINSQAVNKGINDEL
jgi:hypothetical protein